MIRHERALKTRKAISPFLASVMLIVITMMIGGVLYNQFRTTIVSQVRNPSITLSDFNVGPDGQTLTSTIKNDGNVQLSLQAFSVSYGASSNSFSFSGRNATLLASGSGTATLKPGDLLSVKLKTTFAIPAFSSFTFSVVADQISRAFTVQA